MSATSSIEWTDRTWNPVRGCSVISPGCVNCYAMKQAHRFSGEKRTTVVGTRTGHQPYHGLTKLTKAGPQWTGVIRTVEGALVEPLSWRKPQRVFVNSMSDLFHEDVPDAFIDQVFAVMALARRHTFQILTKRADRMREYCARRPNGGQSQFVSIKGYGSTAVLWQRPDLQSWPLPNVWLGVSVEDQKRADERIPQLLQTSAAVRFISAEPLLGPLNIAKYLKRGSQCDCGTARGTSDGCEPAKAMVRCNQGLARLSWVIPGGESGNGARPCDVEWIRSLVEQCQSAAVPVFVKQVGSRAFDSTNDVLCRFDTYEEWVNKARSWLGGVSGGGRRYKRPEQAVCVSPKGSVCANGGDFMRVRDANDFPVTAYQLLDFHDRKGGDFELFPNEIRVRQFPEVRA
jgi:protein gp37